MMVGSGSDIPSEFSEKLRKLGFVLRERIGGGAHGTVFRAEQVSLGRPVAVKFFDRSLIRGEGNRKRFDREAPLLARVQHPAIPYVITMGKVEMEARAPVRFAVMQYIAGVGLDRLLSNGKPEVVLVYEVMRDLLSALGTAHQQGVVHRDVKPDNIIHTEQGTYLIDFSIGMCISAPPGRTRATETGERLGTFDYAAPEQLVDSASVDHRADLYSAGVVLAEMLGARPRLRLETLDSELSTVRGELRAVIRKAAADAPEDRFQHGSDFLDALEPILGLGHAPTLAEQTVLCPNPRCAGGTWSSGSGIYYWGPKIIERTSERFCESCGTEFMRSCRKCGHSLPPKIASLVAKYTKTERDALEAYCSRCGDLIFRTPTCARCGSYLTLKDIGSKTAELGCEKCRKKRVVEPPPLADDDIPF